MEKQEIILIPSKPNECDSCDYGGGYTCTECIHLQTTAEERKQLRDDGILTR